MKKHEIMLSVSTILKTDDINDLPHILMGSLNIVGKASDINKVTFRLLDIYDQVDDNNFIVKLLLDSQFSAEKMLDAFEYQFNDERITRVVVEQILPAYQ